MSLSPRRKRTWSRGTGSRWSPGSPGPAGGEAERVPAAPVVIAQNASQVGRVARSHSDGRRAGHEGRVSARWGFHGLRHYYATLLIHAGASVKTVQLALGHSTPTITLKRVRARVWPDALDRTRSLVDGALGTRETAATPAASRS
jgi:integrase